MSRSNFVNGVIFVLVISIVGQFLFSHLGFNPTDDGYILASSRRIVDGDVVHRDFVLIRTAGTYFLQTPFILLNTDNLILVSRFFVWLQLAVTSWLWVLIFSKVFGVFKKHYEKFGVAAIALFFGMHNFPLMVWNSFDALFFTAIGITLVMGRKDSNKILGYFLIGLTMLMRQNFVVLIPATLLLLGDWKKSKYWLVSAVPFALYLLYLGVNNGLLDFVTQMTAHSSGSLFNLGILTYAKNIGTWAGLFAGLLVGYFAFSKKRFAFYKWFSLLVLFGGPILLGALWGLVGHLSHVGNLFVFGSVLGVSLGIVAYRKKLDKISAFGLLSASIAWMGSLSVGYNTPALSMGILVLFLISFGSSLKLNFSPKDHRHILLSIFLILLVVSTSSFVNSRYNSIYREPPASELTYSLDGVLRGAAGLKTNYNTYLFLKDFNVAKELVRSKGKEYAILPDLPVNWVTDIQRNPLMVDWGQNVELGNKHPAFVEKVTTDLISKRASVAVIIQKYEANRLAEGFIPFEQNYVLVDFVKDNYNKTGETTYFEIYE